MNTNQESNSKDQPQKKSPSLQPKFRSQFHKQVLVKLLEILELSKQVNIDAHKSQIRQHFDEIALLGRKAQIQSWGQVLATAKRVLNNDNDDYQQTLKIVIQEIKHLAELVLNDRCDEIVASQKLKALAQNNKPQKIANLQDRLDTQSRRNTLSRHNKQTLTVDAQDLNSLADVFETNNELEERWQQGEIISSENRGPHNNTWSEDLEWSGEEQTDNELNEIFGEELSLIEMKPTQKKKKRVLKNQDTLFLFGEDFSFNGSDKSPQNAFEEKPIKSLNLEDISLSSQEEDNDLEMDINKMFEEDFTLEEEKLKQEKKIENDSRDTMVLFGEDFSFEQTSHSKEKIDPKITQISAGEVFGDELSLNLKPKSKKPKKTMAISKDTTHLFGEDFSFEETTENNQSSDQDLDINDLFGDEVVDTSDQPKQDSWDFEADLADLFEQQEDSSETDFNDLFDLVDDSSEVTNLVDNNIFELESVENEIVNYFYEPWEELEHLIIEDSDVAIAAKTEFNIQNLLSIIEAPALETNLQLENYQLQSDGEEDEDFADLEAMLRQTVPGMAGQTTITNNLTANKTGFEQTMKVPVKQLDNLNNLMGELVVNRNSLEQDQERMRQFLDNLLNHVANLSDVGSRLQDLYERSLLESSLSAVRENALNSRNSLNQIGNNSGGGASDATVTQDYDPLEMDRFTGFHLISQEMIELIVRVRESSSDIQFVVDDTEQIARNLRQITSELQEGLNKSRMVSFAETADRMRAAVRRVSVKLNKQAELYSEGRDVLIDKMIAEQLFDPMTHLVNNALTHGIETPEERIRKGKNLTGKITIGAYIQGNQTIITVADDGAGINPEILKDKAMEKGLISRLEADNMSDQQAYDLIFKAGFSTKDQADDFAGRGVGMDVVRTALNEIRGTINIDSTVGKGTTFSIRLPLMLTISKALCCLSDHHRIAFPMDGVEDMQDFFPKEIQTNEKGEKVIPWRNHLLPFKPLTKLLKYNRQIGRNQVYGSKREDDMVSIIILRSAGNYLAVQVDQVLGEQEIVIKQIKGPVPKPPGIAGATVLGDGRIMGIIDVLELIDIAQGKIRHEVGSLWQKTMNIEPAESEVRTEPMVLIVDDSITVRELLSMTFNKAGYRVEQARDGQEAWDKLRAGLPCDMVFCDIEMPRMDGLELLSNIQKDEKLNHLPVAMLTSRGADRHKQMAAQLGASAYFTKPYLEEVLLEGAARMMKGDVLMANSTRKPGKQRRKAEGAETQKDIRSASMSTFVSKIPTVLIIDDSVVVRELLSSTFQNAGYKVEQARDGQEAWEKLNEGLNCDVVFCDIEMPRMNGLDLLSNLQNSEELSQLPIAMLTSRGAERHRRIAAERGAKGYFTKPYMDDVLLDAAQRLMKGEVLIDKLTSVSS